MKFVEKVLAMPQLKIETIKKARKKGFYDIQTSNGKYCISENLIVEYEILKDREFDEELFNKIIQKNNKEKLLISVYNYISYQMRSTKEVVDYLRKKEASIEDTDNIINKLIEQGYINDEMLSKYILDDVIRNKKGPKYLENKLKLKGIESKIIYECVSKYTSLVEEENIAYLINKLKEKNSDLPIKKQKERIAQKLIRDGFSSNVVFRLINITDFDFNGLSKLEEDAVKIIKSIENSKYGSLSSYEKKNKIVNKLLMKGYEYEDIKNIISDILLNKNI